VHEYSLVSALLDRVEQEARARGARSVARVRVRLGGLSGVEPELFATAFEMARAGTICRDAVLDVARTEVSWTCPLCEKLQENAEARCPECGLPARLAGTDEIVLERIEMEVA
jgi:hydrogenase nickel incorporation protein HypA/HybF